MKTKKLFLMAAMLLTSMCAFAQGESNEPLKGDVNGDGKVDVADITAIIAIIMNNTSQTTYYWYGGQTTPNSIDLNDIKTEANEIGWHKIEGNPTSIHVGQLYDPNKAKWVVLIPTKYNITELSQVNIHSSSD